jgi:hypothetical protein
MFRAPENSQSRFVAARFDADRKGLSPFGRISSPSLASVVRQVHGGDRFSQNCAQMDWSRTRGILR